MLVSEIYSPRGVSYLKLNDVKVGDKYYVLKFFKNEDDATTKTVLFTNLKNAKNAVKRVGNDRISSASTFVKQYDDYGKEANTDPVVVDTDF